MVGANSTTNGTTVHHNPNNMASSARHGGDSVDPQVQLISNDPPLPTLCDVVSSTLLEGRDEVRPTVSRLTIVGELPSKEDSPRAFFEDCMSTATKRVNAADPTNGKGSSHADPMNITGLFVELPGHFIHLAESEPQHLVEYMKELHSRVVAKKSEGVAKVHVVMYIDDVVKRTCNKSYFIDIPPSVTGGQLPEGFVLEHVIVDQTNHMLQLVQMAQTQSKVNVENFLASAKNQNSNLVPKTPFVEKCIACGLCLTLDEYVQLFAGTPNVVRANDVLHPVEEPLPHAH